MTLHETKLPIVKLHPEARLPQQSIDDVGFDVFSVEDVVIPHMESALVSTGLGYAKNPEYPTLVDSIGIRDGLGRLDRSYPVHDNRWSIETKIQGRSGLASKRIFPLGGVVDPSYRGPIKAILLNLSGKDFEIKQGDKIAQLVLHIVLANTKDHSVQFEFVEEQEESDRGDGGFGSTGR